VDRFGRFKALTTAVVVALVVCAVLDVVAVASDVSYRNLIQNALAGATISLQQADSADHRQAVIGWWQVGVLLATAVLYVVWFRRAYVNVGRLGVHGLRYGPRWAVSAWFVPFLNFVRPKVIANDIWRGSDPKLAPEATVGLGTPVPWYLNVWWAAFLIAGIAGRIAFSSARHASTLSGLDTATTALLVSDALDLVAAIAAVAVVVDIFRRQQSRASTVAMAGEAASF
jgi:Domain of unknown function (DUF4328)